MLPEVPKDSLSAHTHVCEHKEKTFIHHSLRRIKECSGEV